jgi:hypothetical protein
MAKKFGSKGAAEVATSPPLSSPPLDAWASLDGFGNSHESVLCQTDFFSNFCLAVIRGSLIFIFNFVPKY